MPFLEFQTYSTGDEPSRRLLVDAAEIESIKEQSDDTPGLQKSFGLQKPKAPTGAVYLELRTKSGATHLVSGDYDRVHQQLTATGEK